MHVTAALWISRSVRLRSELSLKTVIPSIVVSPIPPILPSTVTTAPYHLRGKPPPLRFHPYRIIHDSTLAGRLMSSLNEYLAASPTGNDRPSTDLQNVIDVMPTIIRTSTSMTRGLADEATSTTLWGCFDPIISHAVREIDQNDSLPSSLQSTREFSQLPDRIMFPSQYAGPRILREEKSPSAFSRHAPKIVDMGKGVTDGQHGSPLYLRDKESDHRSLLLKIGVAMIAAKKGPIPYAILFGGDQFMLFSLFHNNKDDSGATQFGLFCSDIIETCSTDFPIVPLTIFMLLGKDRPASLIPSAIAIPPVSTGQKEKKVRKTKTTKKISQSLQKFIPEEVFSYVVVPFGESLTSPA